MKHKSEVFNVFKQWKAKVENQTGRKLKCIICDNETEYKENTFLEFCKNEGIARHFTVKKTPQHNGVAKRMNITLLERARCMRLNTRLPKMFWVEVVNTVVYLINRSPCSAINFKVPEEVWTRRLVNKCNLRIF